MAQDPNGLFEDARDDEGQLVLSELGQRFMEISNESLKSIVDDRMENMVETVDQYFQQEITSYVNENVEDSVAELRKLMLLAVASIGGQEKAREFVRKVAELARAGALSASSAAWAQGSPGASAENRQSIAGGSGTLRKESVEREEVAEIFNEAVADMSEDGKALMMELCGEIEYSGDAAKLRREIELVRNQQVRSPLTENYVRAISRTIRR
jgi:hypothetical protein